MFSANPSFFLVPASYYVSNDLGVAETQLDVNILKQATHLQKFSLSKHGHP